jgi:hypothetical protein
VFCAERHGFLKMHRACRRRIATGAFQVPAISTKASDAYWWRERLGRVLEVPQMTL